MKKKITVLLCLLFCCLSVFALPPTNDDCQSAEIINFSASATTSLNVNHSDATYSGASNPSCANTSSNATVLDTWYQFTLPVDGNLKFQAITNINNMYAHVVVYKYDSTSCYDETISYCGRIRRDYPLFIGALDGGEVYIMRIVSTLNSSSHVPFAGTVDFDFIPKVPNDECSGATDISLSTDAFTGINLNLEAASPSTDAYSCSSNSVVQDAWYRFVMPVNGELRLTGSSLRFAYVTLYETDCSGTEIFCENLGLQASTAFITGLEANTTYILRFGKNIFYTSPQVALNLRVYEEVTNSTCDAAIPFTLSTTTPETINLNTQSSDISPGVSCAYNGDTNNFKHVWYDFTMPIDGNLKLELPFSEPRLYATLYDGCSGNEVSCKYLFFENNFSPPYDTDIVNYIEDLQGGTSYKLRISQIDYLASVNENMTIDVIGLAQNNDCIDATDIVVQHGSPTIITPDLREGTKTTSSVDSRVDLWYKFTMPADGTINVTETYDSVFYDSTPTRMRVFESICSGSSIFEGNTNNAIIPLVGGTTYYVSIEGWLNRNYYPTTIAFAAQITATNDTCTTAEVINVATSNATVISPNLEGASFDSSIPAECEASNPRDLWYEFTMPVNGNVYVSTQESRDNFSAYNRYYYSLYDQCSGSVIACDRSVALFTNLIQGNTYKLRTSYSSLVSVPEPFIIQAFETAINDECTGAIPIMISTTEETFFTLNQAAATASTPFDGVLTTEFTDVWYQFTMPIDGNIYFYPDSYEYYDERIAYYDACSGQKLGTAFEFDPYLYNLVGGQTYLLRYAAIYDLPNVEIQSSLIAVPAASNVDCSSSENIVLNVNTPTIRPVDSRAAAPSPYNVHQTCVYSTGADNAKILVYDFTMPVDGNVMVTFEDVPRFSATRSVRLQDTCDDTANNWLTNCKYGTGFFQNITAGENYSIKLFFRASEAIVSNVKFEVFETLPNDECANAIPISVTPAGACGFNNTTVDLRKATSSSSMSCYQDVGIATDDVLDAWYTFQATTNDEIVINSISDNVYYTIHDACDQSELACFYGQGTFQPTAGSSYVLRVGTTDYYADEVTFCLGSAPLTPVATGTAGICETMPSVTIDASNANDWVSILDSSGNILAAINANGNILGNVTSSVFIDTADMSSATNPAGSATYYYLRREIAITPEFQPASPVSVRFYATGDEVQDLNLEYYQGPGTHISDRLNIVKAAGNTCTEGIDATGELIPATAVVNSSYGDDYMFTTEVNSFSVFYFTSWELSSILSVDGNTLQEENIVVFPTISSNDINIMSSKDLGLSTVTIFDMNGRQAFAKEIEINSTPTTIQLGHLSKGMYFLKIQNDGRVDTQKIIIK